MSHLHLVGQTARELAAKEARARLVDYLDSLSIRPSEQARMRDFITDYGLRQYEAGYDRAQRQAPRGTAA